MKAGDQRGHLRLRGRDDRLLDLLRLALSDLFQALAEKAAQIIALPAAFTLQTGKDHWEVLLRARAIETRSYAAPAPRPARSRSATNSATLTAIRCAPTPGAAWSPRPRTAPNRLGADRPRPRSTGARADPGRRAPQAAEHVGVSGANRGASVSAPGPDRRFPGRGPLNLPTPTSASRSGTRP